ncbi:energy transducer TonB family protein [Sphingobium cloacae]|uniref:TonB family domain-containing protein n=1 Tax=Sphingobium cloacae TaxID=120107 RepID=A0A1E1F599_9SPHN|nr:energy transducer TonB [Sphingobium cloacae]BAV65652.1 TonB family domain-containing protein [Sphingobium cloacae]
MLRAAIRLDEDHRGKREPIVPSSAAVDAAASDGGYRAGAHGRRRAMGLSLTIAVHIVVAGLMLVRWHSEYVKQQATTLSVFDVAPPAPPAEIAVDEPPPPEIAPQQQPEEKVQPEPPKVQIPTPVTIPVPPPVRPTPVPVDKTPPPEVKPAAAPPPPGNAKPTWEGQVLAALNKVRRYPRDALFRKQQGVPYIRFLMDREGKVLSARLERSSGIASLDAEAIALPKRAQPLPKPPASVTGDTIELVVPVEFFLR